MTDVGAVYGNALYDLAVSEGLGQEILGQLQVLSESFSREPDFLKLLSAQNLPKAERCGILQDSFSGQVHPYVLNFLKILTERGYVGRFFRCYKAYREQYNQDNNILPVTAVTAVPLREDQSARLAEKLQSITGKHIELINRIEPACLGGIRLDYDGKELDDTIAHRLESVRSLLKNTLL